MNNVKMTIWNRIHDLKVLYECYGDQEPTVGQETRLDAFKADKKTIEDALITVKQFCLQDENMTSVDEISNIFKYVIPRAIYVKRNDSQDIIALLCDYKFDLEHGIAIVFEKGILKEIVQQGDI